MNRTNVGNGMERVTYTGDFSRYFKEADECLSLDEKISFYSDEIFKIEERIERKKATQLSSYINNIRTVLHKNNCREEYIQLHGKDKNTEVELYILSSSKDILNFIDEIQSLDDNLTDIKKISIHNSEDRNRIQTIVCFESGIELKSDTESLFEYTDKKIESSELDRIFYKNVTQKKLAQNTSVKDSHRTDNKARTESPLKLRKLTFVGLTKSGGKTFVLAKDEEMENLCKVELTDVEKEGDFCIQTDYGYKAKIRGNYYEVKR